MIGIDAIGVAIALALLALFRIGGAIARAAGALQTIAATMTAEAAVRERERQARDRMADRLRGDTHHEEHRP